MKSSPKKTRGVKRVVKAWIWKGFNLYGIENLNAVIRPEKPSLRNDFVPCTITYTLPSSAKRNV